MKAETLRTADQLSREFGNRFLFLPHTWTQHHVDAFRQSSPDKPHSLLPFWNATTQLGRLAMQKATGVMLATFGQNGHDMHSLAVAIPRGAYPFFDGIRQYSPNMPFIITNDGGNKNPEKPLVPENVPSMHVGTLLLADPVIDTGTTIRRTVASLVTQGVIADQMIALGVIVHSPTARALLEEFPTLHIVTADIEDNWIPAPNGEGRWLAGFGDIGGNVQAAAKHHPELERHLLQPAMYHTGE